MTKKQRKLKRRLRRQQLKNNMKNMEEAIRPETIPVPDNFKKDKNFGFIEEPLDPNDWAFGSSGLGKDIIKPDGNWIPDLPTGEVQKRNDQDKMACVTYSALNAIETEFNYRIKAGLIHKDNLKWLMDKGYINNDKMNFSDRFIAKLSGTSTSGNSLKRVGDTIRKLGLIPEVTLPYTRDMSWAEYYSGITNEMMKLGAEFLKHFTINYEAVDVSQHNEALKYNPVQAAIHAYNGFKWDNDKKVYTRTNNGLNHAIMRAKSRPKYDTIFDTYVDDGSYLKQTADDFIYMSYGYRYIITENLPTNPESMPEETKHITTVPGYFEKDIKKILIPAGTTLTGDEMFTFIPYLTQEEIKQQVVAELSKEKTLSELFKLILDKIFKK